MLKQQMGIESTIAEALRAELTAFKESVELMGWKLAAFERRRVSCWSWLGICEFEKKIKKKTEKKQWRMYSYTHIFDGFWT